MSKQVQPTASQHEAVNCNDRSVLVLAGPGSGKTYVLTQRIARIIEESEGKYFKILGLTFTNKAAMEMQKRIEDMVPGASGRITITTFHAFSASLLRQHGSHLGIQPDFTILTQHAERIAVLKEATERADVLHRNLESMLHLVTKLLERDIRQEDAVEFLQECDVENAQHIGMVYKNYRDIMVKNSELDFVGLVAEALRLLRTVPAVQKMINAIYPYVCVDEFQDTNMAQYQLLRGIVNPITTNLFVAADDDQTIYQWNGANPEWLVSLREEFRCRVLELPVSYRCPPEIVKIANRLIVRNASHDTGKAAITSHMVAGTDDSVSVEIFGSAEDESDWIADDISRQSSKNRLGCAVLGRNRGVLKPIVEKLKGRGIQCHLPTRKNEFVSAPMAWLYAMLHLANVRQGREQLDRVCRTFFALEGVKLVTDDIMCESLAGDGNHLRAWLRAALRQQLNDKARSFLEEAVPRLADRLDLRVFVDESFKWFEQLPSRLTGTEEYKDEKSTWDLLAERVNAKLGYEHVTLAGLLHEIDLQSKTAPTPEGSIPCYTVHASKGLEFDHVYLAGLVEGTMPDWRAIRDGDESDEMQEERRICFVAITRARHKLTLTLARNTFGRQKDPSRFLKEMGLRNNRV